MSTETKVQAVAENASRLLSPNERTILGHIVDQEPPFSQRAQALLAIDEGAAQSAASRQTGLSIGQVRYWLGKFRKNRLSIFPEELLDQAHPQDTGSPQLITEPIPSPDIPDTGQTPDEKNVQQELPTAKEEVEPAGVALAPQEDSPETSKKAKKKTKKSKKAKTEKKQKKEKRAEKEKKNKKQKKSKKGKKGKKPKKKAKKKKAKAAKGKSGKKAKKKRNK